MKTYIEFNYLSTMILMLTISIQPRHTQSITKQILICSLCTFLSFISEYPSVYMITYFLLTNHPHHTTTLQHIITYILIIELLTTFLPFTHTHYLLQIPAHISIPSLLFIFLFSILLLFTKYTKILTHYSQVSLHIPHHIITGVGYKDSGNVALVDQRPLLFLKYEPLLEEHFTHAHSTHVSTIEGEHEVKCIGAEVYIDQRYKGECYVAMVHFDEVYDVILNARI